MTLINIKLIIKHQSTTTDVIFKHFTSNLGDTDMLLKVFYTSQFETIFLLPH